MSQVNLDNLRHSTAHLLAAAVMHLWPETKRTIGPAIENGFYFDFDFSEVKTDGKAGHFAPSEEDFPKIEAKMKEILSSWKNFERHELTAAEAKKEYPNNQYKEELIEEFTKDGGKVTFYKSGDYWDLCKGGHVEHPHSQIKHFKLLSVAGAYWRGDEKNPMLTRIYGTVWPTAKELEDYLNQIEEAKKRDHRKIGKDLGLFTFSDLVGKGLPLLTSKGATIRRELERFIVDEEIKRGYEHVITPPLAKVDLYRTSGHYPYYKDTMYPPMIVDDEELILRPMTCPHHFMLYKSELHSYKELPVKLAEISPQFRYEKSGELTGLMRVRMFTLTDAHIITRASGAKKEIKEVLELIDYVNNTLGLVKGEDYRYRLSLGNRNEDKKYYKDDAAWDKAESTLREVLKETDAPFYEAAGEAAFYGPKIDIQMKNVLGKEETAFTIQYDFVQPKRFELTFINEEGQEEQPIVIHRSSLGAFERIMAFLIERYAGNFPTWLAPIQVKLIPIADRHLEYAQSIQKSLREKKIRVEIASESETMQAKIRDAQLQKIPYMLVIGDKEQAQKKVAVRSRDGKDLGVVDVEKIVEIIRDELPNK